MPVDNSLALRRAVVAHLKADAGLTSLVSAGNIHGEQPPAVPAWPFIRYGMPITGPFEATCWDGSESKVTIHAFAHGPFTDAVVQIASQITVAMTGLAVPGMSLVDNEWTGTQIIRDTAEADAYHAIIEFDVTVI